MGQRRFATGGSTFTATSVLPPRSSSGGKHNGKHGNGRRGRGGVSFIPTRETKQEGSSLIDATSTESARKKSLFFCRGPRACERPSQTIFLCREGHTVGFHREEDRETMGSCLRARSHRPSGQAKFWRNLFVPQSCMDLGFLMSDPPVRNIKINLLLARNNVCVSYSFVIFDVGRQNDGRKPQNLRH